MMEVANLLIRKLALERVHTLSVDKPLEYQLPLSCCLVHYCRVVEQTDAGCWSDYRNEIKRDMTSGGKDVLFISKGITKCK